MGPASERCALSAFLSARHQGQQIAAEAQAMYSFALPAPRCGALQSATSRAHAPECELMLPAPECEKTASLRAKQQDLAAASNTEKLTAVWIANLARDVSGRQALLCADLLDYTTETPEAALPEVVQLMWVHFEEPDPDGEVLDPSGIHIWYRVALRDMSGSVLLGIPQRCALVPAGS